MVKEQVLILSTEREEKVCTRVNEFDVVWRKEKGIKEGRVRREIRLKEAEVGGGAIAERKEIDDTK